MAFGMDLNGKSGISLVYTRLHHLPFDHIFSIYGQINNVEHNNEPCSPCMHFEVAFFTQTVAATHKDAGTQVDSNTSLGRFGPVALLKIYLSLLQE
jgi:hypothetical protein